MIKNILLIVQNNSFPFDKRVLREAISLKENNFKVFVISPRSEHDNKKYEIINNIVVRRYKDYLADGGLLRYILEYSNALIRIHALAVSYVIKEKIDVIHVGNPPDFFWPLALICKIFGIKFIYDQHDLAPEMSISKFQSKLIYKLLLFNEKQSVKLADKIIVVNNTFKTRLINKWGMKENKCHVVYNGPLKEFNRIESDTLKEKYEGNKVVLYVGLMTVNDHIEVIINAANEIVNNRNNKNIRFILLGDGDVRKAMEELSKSYNLNEYVEFIGIVGHETVKEYLSLADVCIAPDLPNDLNEYLTLVKVLEYMKCSKAFVSFKLKETMNFAKDAGLYAEDEKDFVDKIEILINNPQLEKEMGAKGNKIIIENYLWEHSEKELLKLYSNL